jgi:uncharacterized membrane protein
MKRKTRNILVIILSIIAMLALAMVDLTSHGKLTAGFLGMAVLLLGATIYPSVYDLVRKKKKDKQMGGKNDSTNGGAVHECMALSENFSL